MLIWYRQRDCLQVNTSSKCHPDNAGTVVLEMNDDESKNKFEEFYPSTSALSWFVGGCFYFYFVKFFFWNFFYRHYVRAICMIVFVGFMQLCHVFVLWFFFFGFRREYSQAITFIWNMPTSRTRGKSIFSFSECWTQQVCSRKASNHTELDLLRLCWMIQRLLYLL